MNEMCHGWTMMNNGGMGGFGGGWWFWILVLTSGDATVGVASEVMVTRFGWNRLPRSFVNNSGNIQGQSQL